MAGRRYLSNVPTCRQTSGSTEPAIRVRLDTPLGTPTATTLAPAVAHRSTNNTSLATAKSHLWIQSGPGGRDWQLSSMSRAAILTNRRPAAATSQTGSSSSRRCAVNASAGPHPSDLRCTALGRSWGNLPTIPSSPREYVMIGALVIIVLAAAAAKAVLALCGHFITWRLAIALALVAGLVAIGCSVR